MAIKPESKMVAIVVPLSSRIDLTPDEQISLRHLNHFLGKYDKYMLAPEGRRVDSPGFEIKHFSDRFFGSAEAHRMLQLSPQFYQAFQEYKYILMYHLDALVFSDQLMEWCATDFDLIAAPWIEHEDAPYHGSPYWEGKVGNGGFSLYKIASFLKVLNSSEYSIDPMLYGAELNTVRFGPKWWVVRAKRILKHWKRVNGVQWEVSRSDRPSDGFYANRAQHYYPEFKIVPVDRALRFGFECVPRYCFELTNHTLPFGCHAWPRYDRAFWEPYLLK